MVIVYILKVHLKQFQLSKKKITINKSKIYVLFFHNTRCNSIINEDNQIKELNENGRDQIIHDVIEKMAADALRTLCIAYKDLGREELNWENEDEIINNLTCISVLGIEDPVRKEVN